MSKINQSPIEARGTAAPKSGGSILRIDGVLDRTGHRSPTTVQNRIKRGTFPRPIPIGARAVGWPSDEIDAINVAQIAGADEDTLRALVERLHNDRAARLQRLLAELPEPAPAPAAPAPAGRVVELGRR